MSRLKSVQCLVLLLALGLLLPSMAAAQDSLEYQPRGNRSEGTKDELVGGEFIKLIGAMVEAGGSFSPGTDALPENVSIKFLLGPDENNAFLRVREHDRETFYLLDNVIQQWHPGKINQFSWPSKEVLRPLELTLSQLVVLVRLTGNVPTDDERVAPAVFLPQKVPEKVDKYRFYFQLLNDSCIGWKLFRAGSSEVLAERGKDEEYDVFRVEWDASGHPDGEYVLIVEGHFMSDNTKIEQRVTFRHQSTWKAAERKGR